MDNPLQYIADSGIWERIKEEVILPKIEETASVMNDIVVNGNKLSPQEAYCTKAYTVQVLLEMIKSLDMHKSRRTSPIKESSE